MYTKIERSKESNESRFWGLIRTLKISAPSQRILSARRQMLPMEGYPRGEGFLYYLDRGGANLWADAITIDDCYLERFHMNLRQG